ncbi:hypothetical protein ACFLVO_02650 [Chloroflexota bacterium]
MAFGLQREEIDSLVRQASEEFRRLRVGSGLESDQQLQITLAITEVITQNNIRILEALNSAGIKLN